jgi:hypothetical protein
LAAESLNITTRILLNFILLIIIKTAAPLPFALMPMLRATMLAHQVNAMNPIIF